MRKLKGKGKDKGGIKSSPPPPPPWGGTLSHYTTVSIAK